MLSDSVKALLPSRLYFVTDEFQPDKKEDPVDSDQESNDLAGAETTGARLEDLFQSGNEENSSSTSESDVTENNDFDDETSSSFISGLFRNKTNKEGEETEEKQKGGFRVRRVRRLVRHIEPWSVLKIGLVFYLCVWGMSVIAFSMIWGAASDAGTIDKFESFIEQLFALETFEFNAEQIFRIFILGGLVMVVGGTAITVVLVFVFNLISDLMGGIRVTVIEEETAIRRRKKPLSERITLRNRE
tara:strand:- start:120 stop:851 length:732 start_codon:yes stop_codon:yes gene_type:complete